jgi:hypothetical protein
LTDEAISVVQQRALELCEQQLLRARGRLSATQSSIARSVVEAVVERLLAVPATRADAELLAYLFAPEPLVSERSQDPAGTGIGRALP